jgi:hypothetical protein
VYQKAGHPTLALKAAERALDLGKHKDIFQRIVSRSLAITSHRNLKPDGSVVIPLLIQAISSKQVF